MEIVVILFSALVFLITVILLSHYGKIADNKKHKIDYINNALDKAMPTELDISFFKRYFGKASKRFNELLSSVAVRGNDSAKSKASHIKLERQLRLAGVFLSPQEFTFIKLLAAVLLTALFALLTIIFRMSGTFGALFILMGPVLGLIGPTFLLIFKMKSNQGRIRNQVPDALDLLGVCIEAGLGFDISLLKISEKLHGPFIDELLIVHREITMGRSRRDALQNLANNTDIPELKTFIAALVQAEQLGIPIINVMRIQSKQLRAARAQIAREKGNKAPVKMMIPMVLFVFPVILIILMGPTVMNILEVFGGK